MENFQQVVVPGVAQERDSQMGFLHRYIKWGPPPRDSGEVAEVCVCYACSIWAFADSGRDISPRVHRPADVAGKASNKVLPEG